VNRYPESMTRGQEDLRALLRRAAGARNPDERHKIVMEVQRRTDRPAFEAACALTRSDDPGERELGLDILAQLGYPAGDSWTTPGRPFLEDSLPVVLACCADDQQEVVSSAIMALGHLADPRGLPPTLAHVAHPCAEVRFAVAFALPNVAGDPPADEAADALVRLSRDPDPEVRDWATMGLSHPFEADSEEIRDALAARLTDGEGDIAGEALLGLAQRRDPRALAPLLAWLEREPGNLIVEAAGALAAPEALPALLRLRDTGWRDYGGTSTLDEAIEACTRRDGEIAGLPGAGTL
jgi:HEAT repeat protein